RMAYLDGRAVLARFFGQFARGEGRASQTIATGLRAHIENGVAHAACCAACKLVVSQHAETENIYQRIALETFVEINFAADCGNANAIAIVRDAGDNAGEEPPIGG